MNKDNSQAIFNILSQVVSNGTNFILIMIFTRFLKTNEYGVVSIYQAYVLIFSIIIGLNIQGSIGSAFSKINENEHNNYLASTMILSILSFIFILILTIIFLKPISMFSQLSYFIIIMMIFHSFGTFCFNFITIKYTYLRKAEKSFFISLIISILMILISIISIKFSNRFSNPYMTRILGLSIPYILCGLYVIFEVFYKSKPFLKIKEYWKFCLPICIPLIFHGLSYILLSQTDKIMLQKMTTNLSIVGIYSFFITFVHILNSIYTALNNTWVPIYYSYLKNKKYSILIQRSKRYIKFFSILVCGFILLSPEVVKILASKNYWQGIKLIPIIALSIYAVFMYSFAVNYELYNRESKKIAIGTTLAAIINCILNFFLIRTLGMTGAAIATLISYVLLFIFHNECAKKIKYQKFPYNNAIFASSTLKIIVNIFLFYIFLNMFYIRFMLAIILGLIIIKDIKTNKTFF